LYLTLTVTGESLDHARLASRVEAGLPRRVKAGQRWRVFVFSTVKHSISAVIQGSRLPRVRAGQKWRVN